MTDKPRVFYGYIIVIVSFFVMMLILGLHPSFGVFFKPIIEDLEWTRAVTSGAFSLSLIVGGVAGIVVGGLNDRFGPRLVITLCGLLSAAGYALVSLVENVWQFYLFFGVIVGAGSMVYVPLLSTVARWFVKRRSMMTGIVFMGSGFGMLIMPLVINQLIAVYDWRTTSLIMGVVLLVVVVLIAQFLKRDPGQIGQVAYGENEVKEAAVSTGNSAFSVKEAMLTRQLWLLFAVLLCYGFSFFSIQVHIVPYATDIGISTTGAAGILAAIGGATIVGQALGSVGDKIGYRQAFLIGIILIAIAVFVLIFARELWAFYLFAILLGLAFGNCGTQESPLVAWLFGLSSHGIILGFCAFSFTIGAAIGPVVSGYIFDVTGNYQLAFFMFAGVSIIAVILMILLKPTSTEPTMPTMSPKAIKSKPA